MKTWTYTFLAALSLAAPIVQAQDSSPMPSIPKATSVAPPTTSTVMRTNSMTVLDDKKRLGSNDYVSFRVVEDRDNESQHLRVNDSGELEVPYIGLVQAAGRTCKELAYSVKASLEREYYYHATVIIARSEERRVGKE